ncbi:unnamed protein product [Ascophyllum nodosum]
MLTPYVDDLLVTGIFSSDIHEVKNTLMGEFSMSDLGEVSETLEIEIERDLKAGTLSLSQEKYAKSSLERFGMMNCKPVNTPGIGRELTAKSEESEYLGGQLTKEYQALIGSLIFLTTNTIFDVTFTVREAARFMSRPTSARMVAAKRILRYLRGAPDVKITYKREGSKELLGYCDSSYATTGDPERARSASGTVFFLSGGPIHFSS